MLITGAGARLGKAFAEHLAAQGYRLALHYKSNAEGVQQLARLHKGTSIHQADFGDSEQVKPLIAGVLAEHRQIALLVNNASVFPADELNDLSSKTLLESYAVNTVAPLLLIQALAAHQKPCHIINILDTRVAHKHPQRLVYSLSKRALHQITLDCALQLAPEIRVNAICPGPVLPPSDEHHHNQSGFQQLVDNTPLKRRVELTDLLAAIDYLNKSSKVTGEVLYVDSGQHLGG